MARPVVFTLSLTAASANNIALSQTPVSGTALTLNGSAVTGGVATLDTQRRVELAYGNEVSNRTMIITGTNDAGAAISETLAIPSGGSGVVDTNQDFFTIKSALPAGGGWTAAVTLGTNTVGSSPWYVPNTHITPFEVGASFEVTTGAVNATVEFTSDAVLMPIPIYQPGYSQALPVATPIGFSGMTSLAAAATGTITIPCLGIRLTINSGTGIGRLELIQAGIRN